MKSLAWDNNRLLSGPCCSITYEGWEGCHSTKGGRHSMSQHDIFAVTAADKTTLLQGN